MEVDAVEARCTGKFKEGTQAKAKGKARAKKHLVLNTKGKGQTPKGSDEISRDDRTRYSCGRYDHNAKDSNTYGVTEVHRCPQHPSGLGRAKTHPHSLPTRVLFR